MRVSFWYKFIIININICRADNLWNAKSYVRNMIKKANNFVKWRNITVL